MNPTQAAQALRTLAQHPTHAPDPDLLHYAAMCVEAYEIWQQKTDWVQEQLRTFPIQALGQHRADVLRAEIERLRQPLAMSDDLLEILGRPNFTCADIAGLLRATGTVIPRKAEAEQAHTILFLLNFYLRHGAGWDDRATEELQRLAATLTKEKS